MIVSAMLGAGAGAGAFAHAFDPEHVKLSNIGELEMIAATIAKDLQLQVHRRLFGPNDKVSVSVCNFAMFICLAHTTQQLFASPLSVPYHMH